MLGLVLNETYPGVKWKDVVGLDEPKKQLLESVVGPLVATPPPASPSGFDDKENRQATLRPEGSGSGDKGAKLPALAAGQPPAHVLLFGPPGCGKDHLAYALADFSSSQLLTVSCWFLASKQVQWLYFCLVQTGQVANFVRVYLGQGAGGSGGIY